jgi:hypothetical protein
MPYSQTMAKQPSRPEDASEGTPLTFDQMRLVAQDERKARLIERVINWAGIWGVGTICFLIVREIAGKTTVFHMVLEAMASLKLSQWAAWAIVVLSGGLNLVQLRMRKKLIERFHPKRKQMEEAHDPTRTSSLPTRPRRGRRGGG